ncbi:anti-sigma factor family protein [Sphingobacterium rhinopitheci]|uniref:anti-sigma factor family protein n=1 Tax=Sphingobacterium rhinopitheci TaxID=2781960 RepID=UPI001F525294|nr:hypothetical protein [Sphingobacterium rhinopitheci]MCI0921618.1 hypothetical protein [Sphingobacterium rhinopitheci]
MENHSEKIQEYIDGQLDGDDLLQFEAQLAVDDELRNLLALQKEIHDILSQRVVSKEMEFRGTLTEVANNFRYNTAYNVFNIRRLASVFIIVSILLIGALLFF